jgi:SAM-dependent methyltransferase
VAIHEAAAKGFAGAERYDRSRPGYPPDAVERLAAALALSPGAPVVEIGAGTGKLTRLLLPRAPRLVAVEPVDAMRRRLAALLPDVAVVGGQAEALPLRDGCAGAVVCAQCFHWFDGPAALAEIHRVLRPGGRLGLLWNRRDESVGWVRDLTEIVEPLAGGAPRYRSGRWREAFAKTALFGPLEEAGFENRHEGDPERIVERFASISFVAARPEAERAEVLARVRRLLSEHPETRGRAEIALPYRTELFWCEKR